MRNHDTAEAEQTVSTFYENLKILIDERDIKWKDLAAMIDVAPRSLSSMKSQNQNPGLVAVKRIAEALDVSVEELYNPRSKQSDDVEEVVWLLRRVAKQDDFKKDEVIPILLNVISVLCCDNSYCQKQRLSMTKADIKNKLSN